jgi:carbonic anhydrase
MTKGIVACCLVAALHLATGCQSEQGTGSTTTKQAPSAGAPAVQTKESQAAMTPGEALSRLQEGNARFVAGESKARDLPAKVRATASGQYPFAVVLSCLDSRLPTEMIFDQGIGDMFNARVAGNVLNDDILGSLEFACKASGSKLIVVLGHSNCGAVKGAIDKVELGYLTGLLERIRPAIAAVPAGSGPRESKNAGFVQQVADANVALVARQIRERSPILCDLLDKQEIALVGGMYDLATGQVNFFND